MSLIRLPLIIGAAASFHIIVTPPAKSVRSEHVNTSSNEGWVEFHSMFTVKLLKLSSWIGALAESASTLSFHLSDTHVPDLLKSIRGPPTQPPSLLFVVASGIALGGCIFRLLCYRTLGRFFTFQLSIRKEHTLITTGPYAYVRHPSYTGFIVCYIGVMMMYASPGSWVRESGVLEYLVVRVIAGMWVAFAGVMVQFFWKRIVDEDRMLKEAFGEEWEKWAGRVRYRLVPGVY